jgi:glutamine amidotransferase
VIGLIDYGAGNLTSVIKALTAVGGTVRVVARPSELSGLSAIVIPGVGHFSATGRLDATWRQAVRERIDAGLPLLGVCLGLQWLFEGSEEAADLPGLGLFAGRCFRLPDTVKVPHVGWNSLDLEERRSRLLQNAPPGAMAYFTHSFAAPVVDASVALTTHGVAFTSAVERERVFGTQFHPEKSGTTGLRLLSNFLSIVREAQLQGAPEARGR